jgi:hypothetical protein
MVLYENHLFFDTSTSLAVAIDFARLGFIEIERDFRTSRRQHVSLPRSCENCVVAAQPSR